MNLYNYSSLLGHAITWEWTFLFRKGQQLLLLYLPTNASTTVVCSFRPSHALMDE